jgi:hypothetical protein
MKGVTWFFPKVLLVLFIQCFFSPRLISQNYVLLNLDQPEELHALAGPDTTIQIGETLSLGFGGSVQGGIPDYVFLWSPATGLSDVTTSNPVCTANTTTIYHLLVTDAQGCQSEDEVIVSVVNSLNNVPNERAWVFPNPSRSFVHLSWAITFFVEQVRVYDSSGRIVEEAFPLPGQNGLDFNITTWETGYYLFRLEGPGFSTKVPFVHK